MERAFRFPDRAAIARAFRVQQPIWWAAPAAAILLP
jgi:hypothetical protein